MDLDVDDGTINRVDDGSHYKLDPSDTTPLTEFSVLPSSDVWCDGTSQATRICRFRNLCYRPESKVWFILKTASSTFVNVPEGRPTVELGTVDGHHHFFWSYEEASPYSESLRNVSVRYETVQHFIIRRLHPRNVMHNLHDDVLPMFHVLKQYVGGGREDLTMPFSLNDHRILIADEHPPTDSTRPFQYLSNLPIRFGRYLDQDSNIVCFRDAVVGNRAHTNWYQYGFSSPQGPLDKLPNGLMVREVSEWFVRRIGLPLTIDEDPAAALESWNEIKASRDIIVVLQRKLNRLIVNPHELETALKHELMGADGQPMPVVFVSNERHTFEEQIRYLRRAKLVVGMHGSILAMAMFCRRGTTLLELFPYGVPSENYTPYRTMANLENMGLIYRAWENNYPDRSIPHPEAVPLAGGITHLPQSEQETIKSTRWVPMHICCKNPYWLYRMYQDTHVTPMEIVALAREGIAEGAALPLISVRRDVVQAATVNPVLIEKITCLTGEQRRPGDLWAEWAVEPWLGSTVDHWNIHVENTDKQYTAKTDMPAMAITGFRPGEVVRFRIRGIVDAHPRPWGPFSSCTV
ncbi:hypothetical protein CXG81DRAFT_15134 [Caulochytrium protostelioides]|uniref:Glycosyltransferase 61 catalytic domain-containing protein n=1 Tax=Caulochytrium protostelioides TaxID=1555241 RepID=A0A4V1IU20_9FUNG|nr:hypothetical protein CXG81DRAFT_15134 [Caulochytrium protostelioides]|eukprot:RKO99027.1 hypothetical protein CXG81DRAFT_15134 [Caulochytrium protostelioides]